jgi:hypothetical protein
MRLGIRSVLLFCAATISSLAAAEQTAKITVIVYNYAAIHAQVLAQAEREASRAFERARVAIEWLDCPLSAKDAFFPPACRVQTGPLTLEVRLLPKAMTERWPKMAHELGFAIIPVDGGLATIANVFTHEVEQLANGFRRATLDPGDLLGLVVAHELGHLLLGVDSHSPCGIMRANWYRGELRLIAHGIIALTPVQAERMRSNIRGRRAAGGG